MTIDQAMAKVEEIMAARLAETREMLRDKGMPEADIDRECEQAARVLAEWRVHIEAELRAFSDQPADQTRH